MCDQLGTSMSQLVSIFKRLVTHKVIIKTAGVSPYENFCLKEVWQEAKNHGKPYKLSQMGDPGYFCSPQIISKMVVHGVIVLEGEFSCLKKANREHRMQKSIKSLIVDADETLPDFAFDESRKLFGYVDERPVLVHYYGAKLNSNVVGGT
ncbi:hypothetical protein Golomagni_07535 [Golovinomyces magnicellulatus]|nr:hypothetical protein Golomagni_07535 [Golovinomyces magnicellulatus]